MKINELKKQILNNKFNSTLEDIYYDESLSHCLVIALGF